MQLLETNTQLMLRRSMEYLWQKQTCILDNIANVETPGYQVKYATFEDALADALQEAAGKSNTASAWALREAIVAPQVEIHEAAESVRADGNGVNITEQAVELARNGYQQQYVFNSISNEFTLLRTAIRG